MEAKGLGGTYKNKMDMYVQVCDYHCVSAHICQQREPAASERDKTLRCPEEWTGGEKKIPLLNALNIILALPCKKDSVLKCDILETCSEKNQGLGSCGPEGLRLNLAFTPRPLSSQDRVSQPKN